MSCETNRWVGEFIVILFTVSRMEIFGGLLAFLINIEDYNV